MIYSLFNALDFSFVSEKNATETHTERFIAFFDKILVYVRYLVRIHASEDLTRVN